MNLGQISSPAYVRPSDTFSRLSTLNRLESPLVTASISFSCTVHSVLVSCPRLFGSLRETNPADPYMSASPQSPSANAELLSSTSNALQSSQDISMQRGTRTCLSHKTASLKEAQPSGNQPYHLLLFMRDLSCSHNLHPSHASLHVLFLTTTETAIDDGTIPLITIINMNHDDNEVEVPLRSHTQMVSPDLDPKIIMPGTRSQTLLLTNTVLISS